MKKFTFILICALSLSYASAQATCTDIKVWLTRGMENNNVLALQNFLYDRGYLKAKPNGYFGVGTFAGVKAFQKSLGLEQVGSVGPGTRAAIKKATCGATTQSSTSSSGTSVAVSVQPAQTANVEQVYKPAVPVVNTPSGLRNAKRREDLEKLLKGIYKRYVDSRGEHPVVVTDTPIQLCVKPVYVMNQATATEVAVLTTPDSPCKDYVDIAALCLVITGGILAFLWFNIPPALFYLTETGMLALSLGYVDTLLGDIIIFVARSVEGLPFSLMSFKISFTSMCVMYVVIVLVYSYVSRVISLRKSDETSPTKNEEIWSGVISY